MRHPEFGINVETLISEELLQPFGKVGVLCLSALISPTVEYLPRVFLVDLAPSTMASKVSLKSDSPLTHVSDLWECSGHWFWGSLSCIPRDTFLHGSVLPQQHSG